MKSLLTSLALFFFLHSYACFPGGLYIYSQSDIDAVSAELASCTTIEGTLHIQGDITDLSAFASITTVQGSLEFYSALADMSALASLTEVLGDVDLNMYGNLTQPVDPNGLAGLVYIGGTLTAQENNFNVLPSVNHVGRMCIQLYNPLPDLYLYDFANQLVTADYLMVFGNYLPAFSALQSVDTVYMRSFAYEGASFEMFPLITEMDVLIFGTQNANSITMPNVSTIRKLSLTDDINMPTMCGGMFQNGSKDAPVLPQVNYIDEIITGIEIHSIEGLSALDSIGSLHLWDGYMTSLDALSNLSSIHSLHLIGCYYLSNLSGLAGLEHLDELYISNTSLQTLEGINPSLIVPSAITIENNDLLTACGYLDYCGSANAGCQIVVQYNGLSIGATTCDDLADVMNACTPYTLVEVYTYLDVNCNNIFEWGTDEFIEVPYLTTSAGEVVTGNFNGYQVTFNLEPNTSYTFEPGSFPGLQTPSFNLSTGDPFTTSYAYLGYCPVSDFKDAQVASLPHEFIRTDYESIIVFNVKNMSAETTDITASLSFGIADVHVVATESVVYSMSGLSSIPEPGVSEWSLTNVGVGETVMIQVRVAFDNILPLGTTFDVHYAAHLTDVGAIDFNPANDAYITTFEVVGSYDPNIKVVDQAEVYVQEVSNVEDEELLYTIHFQNTGSAPAINVRVEDELVSALDPSSINVVCSSHDYYTEFDGQRVVFHFNDINLPDSTSNEPESHGFISFNINPSSLLTLPTDVLNSASIFFDFNEPVITAPASTVFYTCPTEEVAYEFEGTLFCQNQDALSYQWYWNGVAIEGATTWFYEPTIPGTYFAELLSNQWCTITTNTVFITSVDEVEKNDQVVLFPNPSTVSDQVSVLTSAVVEAYTIYDAMGRAVVKGNPNSRQFLLNHAFTPGVYELSVQTNFGLVAKTFVVR